MWIGIILDAFGVKWGLAVTAAGAVLWAYQAGRRHA